MTRRCLQALILSFTLAPFAGAGAWMQPPGTAYVRISGGWLKTDQRYDQHGKVVPFDDFGGFRKTTYRDLESILYGEVGVHRDVTLLGSIITKSLKATQTSTVFKAAGISDGMIGVKGKLWKRLWHVGSVSAEWWFPTGYKETQYPSLGSGSHTVRLGVHAGASAGKYWANADFAYGLRESPFRDQLLGLFSGGYALSRKLDVRGSLGVQAPLGEEKESLTRLFDPATVDARLMEASAVLSLDLGDLALEAEVRGPLQGENSLQGTRLAFALATSPRVRLWRAWP